MHTTTYCLDHYRFHHPEADRKDLVDAILFSERITSDMAMVLLGRVRNSTDTYLLAPDRRGLFVQCDGVFFNYLRFQRTQQTFCLKHWPVTTAPVMGKPAPVPVEDQCIQATTKKSIQEQLDELPTQHPEAPFIIRKVQIGEALLKTAGGIRRARILLGRTVKQSSTFDQNTWAETFQLEDPKTHIKVEVRKEHRGTVEARLVA